MSIKYERIEVRRINFIVYIVNSGLLFFIFSPISNVRATSSTRYYAGYYYNGGSGPQHEGVQGNIFTIYPHVPYSETCAEWIDISLSIYENYWVQLGYVHHWVWFIFPFLTVDFYVEKNDINGRRMIYPTILKPLNTHTYTYKLLLTGSGEFSYYVYESSNLIFSGVINTDPDNTVDLLAFVETSVTSIKIDGSHFMYLRYKYTGSQWPLWDRHEPYWDYPYYLDQRGHYEFAAYGGG
ncbi:MAG: hypothetical protein ACTSUX_02225 [Promethearchaeota archaeon]